MGKESKFDQESKASEAPRGGEFSALFSKVVDSEFTSINRTVIYL